MALIWNFVVTAVENLASISPDFCLDFDRFDFAFSTLSVERTKSNFNFDDDFWFSDFPISRNPFSCKLLSSFSNFELRFVLVKA